MIRLLLLSLLIAIAGCNPIQQAISQADNSPKTEAEKAAEKRSLSPFEILEGTPYRFARITEGGAERGGFSSSGYSDVNTRNIIFLNAETKNSTKLLPKSNVLVPRLEKIGRLDRNGKLVKVEALWYQVIQSDSNGDKPLDYRDKSAIAISTAAGTNYKVLIPQVDQVLNVFQAGSTKATMIYELDKKYFVADVDLAARQVTETRELPNLE